MKKLFFIGFFVLLTANTMIASDRKSNLQKQIENLAQTAHPRRALAKIEDFLIEKKLNLRDCIDALHILLRRANSSMDTAVSRTCEELLQAANLDRYEWSEKNHQWGQNVAASFIRGI